MLNGELIRILAQAIFTTSDNGSYDLYVLFSKSSVVQKKVLTEYIYLKAYIAGHFIAQAAATQEDLNFILNNTYRILDECFKKDIYSTCDPCSYNVMVARTKLYMKNEETFGEGEILSTFIDNIGRSAIRDCDVNEKEIKNIIELTFEQLKKIVIDNYEQSNTSAPVESTDRPKKITAKDIGKGIGFYIIWTICCFVFLGVLVFIIDKLF
jgi:hypothetical protein